ncbi:MAG: NUDIX hydrolase [Candidatus Marsarchaeota archaeon]|nr:NUDIX hydrolase [Candidatus Marsarchaeota archaeon]
MSEEKKITVSVHALLENSEGKFALVLRSTKSSWGIGEWQLPGGKMEWGEKPIDTLEREVFEETGLKILDTPKLLGLHTAQLVAKGNNYHTVQLIYRAKVDGTIRLSSEHDDYKWVSLEEAKMGPLATGLHKTLMEIV